MKTIVILVDEDDGDDGRRTILVDVVGDLILGLKRLNDLRGKRVICQISRSMDFKFHPYADGFQIPLPT